jgi:hypothetical protein
MTRRYFSVILMWSLSLAFARDAGAQAEGGPCEPEPTDQLISYGDFIVGCDIGLVGDSDLFRFHGVAGEVVALRVTDLAGTGSNPGAAVELLRPNGTVVASTFAGGTAGLDRALDQTGTFTIRVTELLNDEVMVYAIQLDRLSPPSPSATSVNPGDTLLGHVIAPVGDADLFVFNGVTADVVSIRVTDQAGTGSSPGAAIELIRPDGTLVTSTFAGGTAAIDRTLDQTGTHVIRVSELLNDEVMTFNVEYNCITGSCPTFHTLSVARSGAGRLTSNPAGIDCGTDCLERYFDGTVVGLTATPDPGWTFAGWTGDSDCADGTVTMNGDRHCLATFTSGSPVPTTVGDAYSTGPGMTLAITAPGVLANDDSHGGGAMTAVLVADVSHGSLALSTGGGFTYTPAPGFSGVDTFSYRAHNANGPGNPATVTLTVTSLPLPIAMDDSYSVETGTPLNVAAPGVLGNDNANGGGAMSAVLVTSTAHGSLALNASGGFSYVPAAFFIGSDTFTYRASTTAGTGTLATVTITVTAPSGVQAPRNLVVVGSSGLTVKLRWEPPAVGPTPTGYVLKGGLAPGQVLASIPTGSPATFVTFVAPSGSFFIRMHSVLGASESGPSNEVALHVNVPVPPSPPANLLGMANGSALALAWRNTFEGGPPSSLILDVSGSFTGSFTLGAVETFTFTGVPAGTYTLALRASNAGGTSAPSNAVTLTFPSPCSGAPSAPVNFLAYRQGRTVSVDWEPPAAGPAPTGYVLNVTGTFAGSIATAARTLSGSVGPGAYGLSVRAVNPCGASAFTPEQIITVP